MAEQTLSVQLMAQDQTSWCWAAIASAMSEYTLATSKAQCEIVGEVTNDAACCAHPEQHNTTADLDNVLNSLGISCEAFLSSRFEYTDVRPRIVDARRPVGARIVDNQNGQAHYVLIVGCDDDDRSIVSADPWGTPGTPAPRYRMPFDQLKNNYGGWGWCSHMFRIA